jgi:hypothetical protein
MNKAPLLLAVFATLVAVGLSAVAGMERGGTLIEQLLWVLVAVMMVLACHFLPALCRQASVSLKWAAIVIWLCVAAVVVYGHATFFLVAQQHAGTARAAILVPTSDDAITVDLLSKTRSRVTIADDRATLVTHLTRATSPSTKVALEARIAALDIKAEEARRQENALDQQVAERIRTAARRDTIEQDPVTSRIAALLSSDVGHVDLVLSLLSAGTLEGVACLCWLLVFTQESRQVTRTVKSAASPQTLPINASSGTVTDGVGPEEFKVGGVTEIEPCLSTQAVTIVTVPAPTTVGTNTDDLQQLADAIAHGKLKQTVAGIRVHLGCSQSRALMLRRALIAHANQKGLEAALPGS